MSSLDTPSLSTRLRAAAVPILGAASIALVLLFFRGVLLPFILGVAVVYIIEPAVDYFHRVGTFGWRWPRWLTVVGIYLCLVGGIVAFGVLVIPTLSQEMTRMVREVPGQLMEVRERLPRYGSDLGRFFEGSNQASGLLGARLESNKQTEVTNSEPAPPRKEGSKSQHDLLAPGAFYVQRVKDGYVVNVGALDINAREVAHGFEVELRAVKSKEEETFDLGKMVDAELAALGQKGGTFLGSAVTVAQSLAAGVVSGVVTFVLTFMVAAFISMDLPRLMAYFKSFVPIHHHDAYRDLLTRLDARLAGVIRGQLIICLLNGFLTYLVLVALDMRFVALLTVIATVFTLIPIFGTVISSLPALAIALIDGGLQKALLWLAGVAFIHFLEANFFNPKIMGTAASLHPALVIFALMAGEHTFGLMGALLAVPTMAVGVTLFQFVMDRLWLEPLRRQSPASEEAQ